MKLIVGLGNPGKEYDRTRHNAGFLAVDGLAAELSASWKEDSAHKADIAKANVADQTVLLLKPSTYMNLSGEAVQSLASYYKVAPEDVLAVQDEMDLAPGTMTFKLGGGDAGHNGIASIIERLGTNNFPRLRIGIGRPEAPIAKEDWVLGKMDAETLKITGDAAKAITDWIAKGTSGAMNEWNQKK